MRSGRCGGGYGRNGVGKVWRGVGRVEKGGYGRNGVGKVWRGVGRIEKGVVGIG